MEKNFKNSSNLLRISKNSLHAEENSLMLGTNVKINKNSTGSVSRRSHTIQSMTRILTDFSDFMRISKNSLQANTNSVMRINLGMAV